MTLAVDRGQPVLDFEATDNVKNTPNLLDAGPALVDQSNTTDAGAPKMAAR